jgi:hypothetical protein
MKALPWLYFALTMVILGIQASKRGRSWVAWALGGGLFALVASTLALGLLEAVFIPLSHQACVIFQIKQVVIPALIIAGPIWLLAASWRAAAPSESHSRSN